MINDVLSVLVTAGSSAHGSRTDTSATDATAAGGNALPASGANVPAAAPARPAPEPVDMTRVIEQVNRFLQSNHRNLSFRIDEGSGRTIITVTNPSTGEIVRQIPPEELLSVARALPGPGALLNAIT